MKIVVGTLEVIAREPGPLELRIPFANEIRVDLHETMEISQLQESLN